MLSIDEAIEYEIQQAKDKKTKYDKCPTRIRYCCEMCFHNPKCNEVAEYHEQIAEWLEELKVYHQHEVICNKGYNAGYNKAIDDAKDVILQTLDNEILVDTLHLRLEQLKAGEENE